ncbi:MAG: transposase [Acetatifactor sp.]|nr:transposase [Acetatifactor sp.]
MTDKFHVIKELNKALEDLRRSLRNDMDKDARNT